MSLRRFFARARRSREHAEEFSFHLDQQIEENAARGMPPDEARRAAHLKFGNPTQVLEAAYEQSGIPFLETLARDLRFAFRMLLRTPGVTAAAIACLALGIGATVAIFSVVKAVVLNQLPYSDPDRLVTLAIGDADSQRPLNVGYATVYDWWARNRSFERLSLYRGVAAALVEGGEPELLQGMRVGYDFFDALGVQMQLGRSFLREEDRPDRRYEVILSDGLWTRRFGRDPHIVGRVIHLSDASFTVVGVLRPDFRLLFFGTDPREIFMPLGYDLSQADACRSCQHLRLIGRLKPGVTIGQALAEMNSILRDQVREHPSDYHHSSRVVIAPMRDYILNNVNSALWVLLGAVTLVLLIACANVANLLLARSMARSKEIALRAALGAGRRRLIRQLLTESLLLALVGGSAGVAFAYWGTALLAWAGPTEIPRLHEVRIDLPVLLFSLAASLLTGLVFGVAPAVRASRADLQEALKDQGKATGGRSRSVLRDALIAAEIALAFVLVVGAGLLGKSFVRLMNVDPGYDPHNLLTLSTYVYSQRYKKPEVELAYYDQVMERLRSTPGIEGAAMASVLPMSSYDRRSFRIEDRSLANEADAPSADTYSVSQDYFRVMKIPLKRGRLFSDRDGPRTMGVALISDACARSQFSRENPIGKHIKAGGRDKPWLTIVGIVGDVRQYGLDRASNIAVYLLQSQDTSFGYQMVIRTSIDPSRMDSAVRAAFMAVDKTQPIFGLQTMETYLADSVAERKFTLALIALFGALALLLAAVGIYGVISYAVSLRTREVGIRVALGARRREVVGMVLRQGMILTAAGLGAGLAGSLALTRLLSSLLFEVRPTDLATSGAALAVLAAVALAASYLPARRAASVDPMVALRYE